MAVSRLGVSQILSLRSQVLQVMQAPVEMDDVPGLVTDPRR